MTANTQSNDTQSNDTQANAQNTQIGAGKSALVTGASKGIGRAVAEALAQAGYRVTITSRTQSEIEQAASDLGENVRGVTCDVRNYAELEQAVQGHVEAYGGLDVLFVNAGVGRFDSVKDMSIEDWQTVIETNLSGSFYTVKAALPALIKSAKSGGGYIFTLSSLAGKNPFAGGAAYNASKFGMNGLSEVLMLDLRQDDIKVTQIMPGSVATHFNGNEPSEKDAWKIQPEDIARLTVDLLAMPARTLPSRVEVRPSRPDKKSS